MEDAIYMLVKKETTHHWVIPGDHLMTHFQCGVCNFKDVQGRKPIYHRSDDNISICLIWRSNLDAFWSRRPGTLKTVNEVEDDA